MRYGNSDFFRNFDPDLFYRMWGVPGAVPRDGSEQSARSSQSSALGPGLSAEAEKRDRVARLLLEQVFGPEM